MQLQWHIQLTEKQAHSEVLFPALQEPYMALIDMGKIVRHKMAPLTSRLIMSRRYHLSSFVTTIFISSVLMTPMTQPTPLKMTCTNLSTQESVPDYSFSQFDADTILISGSGSIVIDSADTDIYVAAAGISQKLPGLLCTKRKQETILCRNLVPEEMADCIVPLDVIPTQQG